VADLTQEEFLALARNARVKIPDEDLKHLNWRFNALMEALDDVLDRHPLDQVLSEKWRTLSAPGGCRQWNWWNCTWSASASTMAL